MEKLFENTDLLVETNGSGEIFIRNKKDPRATIRVGVGENNQQELDITAHDATLTPWAYRGLPAIRVKGGRL